MAEPDRSKIETFIELLGKSGLPEERQIFWLDKLKNDKFDTETEQAFIKELEAHMKDLDAAIEDTDEDLEDAKDDFAEAEKSALPHMKRIVDKQPEFQDKELSDYKERVLGEEKKMMDKVEDMRAGSEKAEEAAIRKKLGL